MNKENKQLVPLLRGAVGALVEHPIILFPFLSTAFLQLLTVEILFFSVRPPLSAFFGPIIIWRMGEQFLHYPFNYVAILQIFQYAQYPIFLVFGGAMIAMAISLISDINSGKRPSLGRSFNLILHRYVHIFLSAVLFFAVFYLFKQLYDLAYVRALAIRSQTGIFYFLKLLILVGAPYFSLLMGVIVTALFAFVMPIIVIENKKIFSALILNIKYLWRSCWFVLWVVFFPTLLYVPFLLIKNSLIETSGDMLPSARVFMLIISIFLMMIIDTIVYTAITTYYLIKKEAS